FVVRSPRSSRRRRPVRMVSPWSIARLACGGSMKPCRSSARRPRLRIRTSSSPQAERYSVLPRFRPRFLTAFQFQSNVPDDPVLAAIEMLKALDRTGARNLAKRIPMSFLSPKWRKLIFATGTADRRLYETAVLATLRERLRGSNIWVAGSRDYRAFENYLLPAEAAGNVGIDQETDATRYMNDRAAALHDRLNFVMARAARGDLDGVEIEGGTLYIARAKPAVPDAARDLAIRLNAMLPRVRITEVLRGWPRQCLVAGLAGSRPDRAHNVHLAVAVRSQLAPAEPCRLNKGEAS